MTQPRYVDSLGGCVQAAPHTRKKTDQRRGIRKCPCASCTFKRNLHTQLAQTPCTRVSSRAHGPCPCPCRAPNPYPCLVIVLVLFSRFLSCPVHEFHLATPHMPTPTENRSVERQERGTQSTPSSVLRCKLDSVFVAIRDALPTVETSNRR